VSVHLSIKIARREWRYTITNITPEREHTDPCIYTVVRVEVGLEDYEVMREVVHVPDLGLSSLVATALFSLPVTTQCAARERLTLSKYRTKPTPTAAADPTGGPNPVKALSSTAEILGGGPMSGAANDTA
jgi:hypothetical protein